MAAWLVVTEIGVACAPEGSGAIDIEEPVAAAAEPVLPELPEDALTEVFVFVGEFDPVLDERVEVVGVTVVVTTCVVGGVLGLDEVVVG